MKNGSMKQPRRIKLSADSSEVALIKESRGLSIGSLVEFETLGGSRLRGRIFEFFLVGEEPWYFCRVRVGRQKIDKGICNVELAGAIEQLAGLVTHERASARRDGRRCRRRRRR